MKRSLSSLLSISLLGAALLACGDDDDGKTVSGHVDASTNTSVRDGGGSLDASSGPSSTPDSSVAALSDGQIAGIVATVNMGEITAGNYAATKAQNSGAKDYASMMVTMHTAAQNDQMTLLQTIGLTPADSAVSDMLKSTAASMLQQLMATPAGPGFDLAYVSGQATMHQTVLDLLDSQLLPQADSAPLKAGLQTTRALVKSHLDQAQALVKFLQADAG